MATVMKYNWDSGKLDFVTDPNNPGISHGDLDDLLVDDHTIYMLDAGTSVADTIPRFVGTDGRTMDVSGVSIDDLDNVDIPGELEVGPGGAGDSIIKFLINDSLAFIIGVDDSDADALKISGPAGMGVADYLRLPPSGDVLLDVSVGADSDFLLECGSQKTLELQTTVWDDEKIPIGAMIPGAVPPTVGTFFGSVSVLLFAPGAMNEVYLTIQLPHRYKEGTDIEAHVHWSPTSTSTLNVKWNLDYHWKNIGAAFTGAATTISVTDPGNGVTGEHQVAAFPTITGSGQTISSMLVCRLYRDATNDNYPQNAALLEFDIHFEVNTLGSRQEFIK